MTSITPNNWTRVCIGDILTPVTRPVSVYPTGIYKILGMRWYAKGLFFKEVKNGHEIKAKELYQVAKGDFIYNRLFAWKGSFGIVDRDTEGGYVSGEFPCFRVNIERVEPKFLLLYLSQEKIWDEIGRRSIGQTNISRLRLKENDFLSMVFLLPPLDEQRRIVTHIEVISEKIGEAKRLRQETLDLLDVMRRSILFSRSYVPRFIPLKQLLDQKPNNVQVADDVSYQFAGVYSFGRGVFRGPIKTGSDFAYRRVTRIAAGDFIYPKLMAWEGAMGIVPPECDNLVVSPEFPVFRVNTELVLPETLDTYFRTPSVWKQIAEMSTGTNVRRRRLHPSVFLNYEFPLPPMDIQKKLQGITKIVDKARAEQEESLREMEALLPSVLHMAFQGEL